MWAYIRNGKTLDIDLCDESGLVCISMKGIDTRSADSIPVTGIAGAKIEKNSGKIVSESFIKDKEQIYTKQKSRDSINPNLRPEMKGLSIEQSLIIDLKELIS